MNRDDVVEALELALCAPNWAKSLEHVHAALASLSEAQPEEGLVEQAAKRIHEAMVWATEQPGPARDWQGGNSFAEDKARRAAKRILTALSRNHDEAKIEAFRALAEMEAIERTKSVNFAELRRRIIALRTALKGDSK